MPVGVGFPLPPLTVTVTGNACAVVMLEEDGVTVGVSRLLLFSSSNTVPTPGAAAKLVPPLFVVP